jgi:hypothetical protein
VEAEAPRSRGTPIEREDQAMKGTHERRFTGVPRQLLDRRRVYVLGWVESRWEVIAESAPGVVGVPAGPLVPPTSGDSREEGPRVAWVPITPEEIRDRPRWAD